MLSLPHVDAPGRGGGGGGGGGDGGGSDDGGGRTYLSTIWQHTSTTATTRPHVQPGLV